MTIFCSRILAIVMALTWNCPVYVQDNAKVVAMLGEQTITDRDIDFQLGRTANDRGEPLKEFSTAIMQSAIYMLGQQRQALQTLRSRKLAMSREDVERWLDENGQPKNGEKSTVAEMLREEASKAGISEANLRDHWAFRLSWQRFLQQQLTEANVAKHFENQPKRFNGTRFKVSVVDIAAKAGKSNHRDKLAAALSEFRSQMMSGDLSWKELAAELQKDQRIEGNTVQIRVREDLWARGTGDLEPTVVSSLMKMEPNRYSQPIHTPTGVHLVTLLEVELGSKQLPEVRDEVRAHMLLHLLEHLARQSESQLTLRAIE